MRYFLSFFCCIFLLISAPNPANAGASVLAYDCNVVQSLEKTPTEKSKAGEWAKRKKPIWSKKIGYKSRKPAVLIDTEADAILGSVLSLAGLVFLTIGLAGALAWALWLGGLFVLGIVLLLWAIIEDEDTALVSFLILIIIAFLLGVALLIGGLIGGLAWAWITGTVILFLFVLALLLFFLPGILLNKF